MKPQKQKTRSIKLEKKLKESAEGATNLSNTPTALGWILSYFSNKI
jgi:hypothetical protein